MEDNIKLDRVEDALEDFRNGKFLVVVDDEDRENEGDLIIAAEKITPEDVNFMLKNARGVLCAPVTLDRCARLGLTKQVDDNTSVLGTPFTVTVDKLEGCSTGVSIQDRAATIRALADPASTPETFGRPGHINPLYAQDRGVLQRAGHTEAAVDLARLAGLQPVAALMEIMSDDGSMARLPELRRRADEWGLKLISIRDLIAFRLNHDSLVEIGEEVDMPTIYGHFRLIPFRQKDNNLEHIALIKGDVAGEDPVLVRVHSSCMTGDIFGSQRCECGEQLHLAMKTIDLSVITEATRRLQEKYEYVLLEGAGGLMVPNDFHSLAIDYVKEQGYPVILVTSGKLGSINHTLLSLYACKQYGIPVRTVVYNLYPPTDELITANTLEYLTQYLEKEFPETALITLPEATAGVADIDISSLF